MALLLVLLLPIVLIFLLYYELIWKRFERDRGKGLVGMTGDFIFKDEEHDKDDLGGRAASADGPWADWKYRLIVELHRREQLKPEEAASIVGVSPKEAEEYLDELEGEGKVQQAGDSGRGIFYKIVNES